MASELKVDKIFNAGGDQDSGINLATNDTIKFDIATSTKATMASTGIVTIVGEGGTVTTNLQQGLCKVWINMDAGQTDNNSFNVSSISDEATGAHTINFNNDFSNIRHVPTCSAKESTASSHGTAGADRIVGPSRVSASASLLKVTSVNLSNTLVNLAEIAISVHGDLA